MKIYEGDLLTVEGKKYMTLSKLNYNNQEYIFVNKIIEEDKITDEFYIFKIKNNGIRIVVEENLKNILMPMFQEKLKVELKNII